MKRLCLTLPILVCLLWVAPAFDQNPNYDVGSVWHATYYHVETGMSDAFWKDFHDHLKPLFEEYKRAGLISDFKAFNNASTNGPNDWDIACAILFPNWAVMDQIDLKAATIVAKHYRSREASLEGAKKRSEFRDVVTSRLAREVTPK